MDRRARAGRTPCQARPRSPTGSNARVNPRNREVRRRTRVVGSFPDGRSALMLVCARVRYVTSNEWSTRRYLDMSRLGETVREANRSSPQGRAKTKVRKNSGTTLRSITQRKNQNL